MKGFFRKVGEEISPVNHWRTTEYARLDDTRFFVSIPLTMMQEKGEVVGGYYNEMAELEMALRMYELKKEVPHETE